MAKISQEFYSFRKIRTEKKEKQERLYNLVKCAQGF